MFSELISISFDLPSLTNGSLLSNLFYALGSAYLLTIILNKNKRRIKWIRKNMIRLAARMEKLLELPHKHQVAHGSWVVAAIMCLMSASSFITFLMLMLTLALLFTHITLMQVAYVLAYSMVLVVMARLFYAEAHRERTKILNR